MCKNRASFRCCCCRFFFPTNRNFEELSGIELGNRSDQVTKGGKNDDSKTVSKKVKSIEEEPISSNVISKLSFFFLSKTSLRLNRLHVFVYVVLESLKVRFFFFWLDSLLFLF